MQQITLLEHEPKTLLPLLAGWKFVRKSLCAHTTLVLESPENKGFPRTRMHTQR